MSASKVRMGQVFVEIGADSRKFFAALGKLNKEIGKIGKSMQSLGTRMMGVGAAVAAPIGLAARQFAAFDDAIRATSAVSGATGADLQMLNDKARELGATTSFTAVQVANLMTELGRAGFKPDEINAMTGAVLDLARATGTDAALSAGIMAATLRQFGLGAGDAARAADVLTAAANNTFNTVESLGEALKYAGPVAKSLGLSLEDTTAILGVLGNVGIQGSEAGTALRRLSVISAGAGEKLQELFDVSNTDAAGNLKPLVQILDEIANVTANMPVAERTKRMAEAFGLLGITSANVLSQSADGVSALAAKLRDAEGTARKTAKEMDAGLGGSTRIALSAIEGTALALTDALAPGLQKTIDFIGQTATAFTNFIKQNQELVQSVAKGIAIFIGAGAAILTIGTALSLVSFSVGGLLTAFVVIPAAVLSAAASLATFALSAVAAGISSAISAATIATSWVGSALAGVLAFVGPAVSSIASYVASCAAAAAATVLDAAAVAAGWVSAALPGVMAFVVGAVSGIASYVASCAVAVAASVSSAAAVAAAWLAPVAPIIAIGAAVAGAGVLVYQFGGQLKGALSGVGDLVGQAAGAIGSGFNDAVSDGTVVINDLASTASTTFSGIYDAIAAGDLVGAMDVLWKGLVAGWTRGVAAIMSYVDSWVATFQNTFTYAGTEIAVIWESMWSGMVQTGTTIGAVLMGVVDNMVNGVMAAFDAMVAAVKKSWNWVQSFIVKGYDLAEENRKVDSEMSASVQQRAASRPGVQGRMAQAATANAETAATAQRNIDAMRAGADDIAAGRLGRNAQRADERRAAADAARADLDASVRGAGMRRTLRGQADSVLEQMAGATTMEALQELAGEFHALAATGHLTEAQMAKFEEAADMAADRLERTAEVGGVGSAADPNSIARAAAEAAKNQAEVAGTFSSVAVGGMAFGQSLQQKQLDTLKKIEANTAGIGDEGVIG